MIKVVAVREVGMKQEFTAVIKQHGSINGAYIEPPFDVKEVFGTKRVKVLATFDGEAYRGSLVSMGGCYMLGLTSEMRKKIGKDFGDSVKVTIEKDEEERIIEIPDDFLEALNQKPEALATFEKMSYTVKKAYVNRIANAKKVETRISRIEKSIEQLLRGKKRK